MNKNIEILITLTLLVILMPLKADDIPSFYGNTINLASGYKQLIIESPSTVSVITKEDIKKIGAITIEDVLETVPGIHVSYSNGYLPVYSIRGIGSTANGSILVYLDGISINNAQISSSFYSLGRIAKNIERIEIIKGPGSALYGADAFSGVINIITKKNQENEAGTFIGNNDTFGGWLNTGKRFGDFKVNFSGQGLTTNGSNGIVESDRQSFLDSLFGTNASLAPGPINRAHDEIDLKLESSYKDKARLYLRYIKKTDYGFGVGISNSLDNSGVNESDSWILGSSYSFGDNQLKTTLNINYTGSIQNITINAFPTGAFGGLFNTPVISKISTLNHDLLTKISTIYTGLNEHKLHLGIGFEYDATDDITDERNFIEGPNSLLLPTGSLQSAQSLGALPTAFPSTRYNYYGFIQDEWSFHNDLTLIAGVRADYFSDFDLTVNPRASLIWDISPSLTTKLMYGRAFTAPSFFQLHTNPGLTVTGNSNLKPETIETVEFSLYKTWPYKITSQLNLFWYQTNDLITETVFNNNAGNSQTRIFNNTAGSDTYGVELDLGYLLSDDIMLNFNYSFLDINPRDSTFDSFIVTAPKHQFYASINWDFAPNWTANIRSNSVIGRKRASADKRTAIKDYTKLDFTLTTKQILGTFDLTFKIDNVLDSDIRDPSIDPIIVGDYPLDDRTFIGILSLQY